MKHLALSPLLVLLVLSPAAIADDVYLTNGEVFEGVVAELTESQVRIELSFGTMTLPRSRLDRIERSRTPLQEFEERRAGLEESVGAAPDWLELARWALGKELSRASREALLIAAGLDPDLEGLEPLMRGIGFARDEELGIWIEHDEAMRRRGLVRYDGEWMEPAERARRTREREEAASSRRAERESVEGPSDNEVAMAQIELLRDVVEAVKDRDRQPEPQPRPPYPYVYPYPGYVLGVGFVVTDPDVAAGIHPQASSGGTLSFQAETGSSPWDGFLRRQPGSFLPLKRQN